MQDREHVVLPRKPDHISGAVLAKLSIAKVMEFTSDTLRSGVVIWADDAPRGSALLFLRGAPAVIRDLVQPSTVPEDFTQVSESAFDRAAPVYLVQQACSQSTCLLILMLLILSNCSELPATAVPMS